MFPDDHVLGEEEGGALCGLTWVIDPIDGTANFATGDEYWSISIALMEDGECLLAFIADPVLWRIV